MSTISSAWGRMTALSSIDSNTITATASQLATAPAQLNPSIFQTWRREDQVAYVQAKGTGTPKAVEIGPVGGTYTAAISAEPTLKITISYVDGAPTTYASRKVTGEGTVEPADAADFALAPADLSPATFLSWTAAERLRYATSQGFGTASSGPEPIGLNGSQGRIFVQAVDDVAFSKGPIVRTTSSADIPYYNLAGSSAGMPSAFVMDKAEELFPSLNGTTVTLPVGERPAKFYTTPSSLTTPEAQKAFLADFTGWHSAYQLEYLNQNTAGTGGVLTIPAVGTPLLAAFISKADPTKFFIMNALDKAAFARMEKVDQDFASTNTTLALSFAAVAVKVGLAKITEENVPDPAPAPGTAASNVKAPEAVTSLVSYMNAKTTTNLQVSITMPLVDRSAWTDQLAILQEQLGGMGVVSPKDISKKLADLKDRFDRAFAFFDVRVPNEASTSGTDSGSFKVFDAVVSQKGDITGITNGYKIFLSQEKRIGELVEGRMQIVRDDGVLFGKKLDVPELVFRFQSSYNLQLEAQTVAETEEINQQNALLKTYAAMQDIINQTLAKFEKADEGKKRILGKDGVNDIGAISADDLKIIAMFEDNNGTWQKHPLETLRGITRPLDSVWVNDAGKNTNYDLNEKSHSQWSQFGTRLSEAVTTINQNSQLKMNEVNSLDKQRNRHYELANSSLAKMNDMLSNIARAG